MFAYNIFDGQTNTAIFNTDTIAYNNVFYGVNSAILGIAKARNNIFYFTQPGQLAYKPTGNVDSDYNLFNQEQAAMFGSAGNLLSDVTSESHSLVGDPLFVNAASGDFKVDKTSPTIGNGVNVGLIVDYFGNDVSSPPDIGICECATP